MSFYLHFVIKLENGSLSMPISTSSEGKTAATKKNFTSPTYKNTSNPMLSNLLLLLLTTSNQCFTRDISIFISPMPHLRYGISSTSGILPPFTIRIFSIFGEQILQGTNLTPSSKNRLKF